MLRGASVEVSKVNLRRRRKQRVASRALYLSRGALIFYVLNSQGSRFHACVTIWLWDPELILSRLRLPHSLHVVSYCRYNPDLQV